MAVSPDTLKGYLLEETIAFLIRNVGYRLLTHESEDTQELKRERHGLTVRGRGWWHQADVLGELEWTPAFTFPIRLFVEGKWRGNGTRVGLDVIREAVGVIEDLRQNVSVTEGNTDRLVRYDYRYAVFSTSGFTSHAAQYALAHQISLVDLSYPQFAPLLAAVDHAGNMLYEHWEPAFGHGFRNSAIKKLRYAMRDRLGLLPTLSPAYRQDDPRAGSVHRYIEPIVRAARDIQELFVGVANGAFLLLLQADDPGRFIEYLSERPTVEVAIRWSDDLDGGRTWWIEPEWYRDEEDMEPPFRLWFRVPDRLLDWMSRYERRRAALDAKARFLSQITVFRISHGRTLMARLVMRPETIEHAREALEADA